MRTSYLMLLPVTLLLMLAERAILKSVRETRDRNLLEMYEIAHSEVSQELS